MESVGYFWVLAIALVAQFVASLMFSVFVARVSGVYSGRVSGALGG